MARTVLTAPRSVCSHSPLFPVVALQYVLMLSSTALLAAKASSVDETTTACYS